MQQSLQHLVDLLQWNELHQKIIVFHDTPPILKIEIAMGLLLVHFHGFNLTVKFRMKSPQFSMAPYLKSGIAANVILDMCVL